MFGHNDISKNAQSELAPHALQSLLKRFRSASLRKQRSASMTRKGDEVSLPGFVKTRETPRHGRRVLLLSRTVQVERKSTSPLKLTAGLNGAPGEILSPASQDGIRQARHLSQGIADLHWRQRHRFCAQRPIHPLHAAPPRHSQHAANADQSRAQSEPQSAHAPACAKA